jgi:hypothetical protein
VWAEEHAELATLLWLGCEYSHMLELPTTADERRGIGLWLRLANGRPEIVRESSGNFAGGSTPPPDGRYVATAADRVPVRRWTHLRFYLNHVQSSGVDTLQIPGIMVNGRASRVTVNATETGLAAATDWIRASNGGGLIGSAGDARNALYLGVARDALRTHSKAQFTALSQLGGREFPGSRLAGRLHPLVGRMAGVVVWRAASADGAVSGFPVFDPYSLDYTGRLVRFRADLQESIGERVQDTGSDIEVGFPAGAGIVLSHPAIDLYNELGDSEQAPSFATALQRVYVANGGRPAFVTERAGGAAGIIAPTTRPKFVIERKPLWEPNFAPVGSSSAEQDPIATSVSDADPTLFHYSAHGSAYMRQVWHEEMRMSGLINGQNTPDVFGLKLLIKPRSVSGTSVIFSARSSLASGGMFLECVDGAARVGWYDPIAKTVVSVTTSVPVFRPGYWYYVYLRKCYPQRFAPGQGGRDGDGNWINAFNVGGRRRVFAVVGAISDGWAVGQIIRNGTPTKRGLIIGIGTIGASFLVTCVMFTGDSDFTPAETVNNGAGASGQVSSLIGVNQNTGDSLVIREFAKTATLADTALWSVKAGAHRCSVSFTSGAARPTFTSAVGPVTPKGVLFSGAAAGVVNVGTMLSVATPIPCFHGDMVGMQFQFAGTAANAQQKVYRIRQVNSATQVVVEDEFGATPNLSGITNRDGGVFAGVDLIKSPDFDVSTSVDQGSYDTEFIGTALASDPANGVRSFDGEVASFGWGVVAGTTQTIAAASSAYRGFNIFETATPTELAEIGTDSFAVPIYNATTTSPTSRPGELHFDAGKQFTVVDGQPYAGANPTSTQPNPALTVALDRLLASSNAQDMMWAFTEEPEGVSGRRMIYVAFFDAEQNVISNPGPRLTVEVPAEDAANPGGVAQIVLTDLPISHQRGNIHRYVYMTEADDIVPFRAAIIPDNVASSVALRLDADAERGEVLEVDNAPPPNCSVIGISQAVMAFGDIEVSGVRQRDAILYSKPFKPLQVPFQNTLFLVSGSNERISAMADMNGVLLVWKKDALIEIVFRDGAAFQTVRSRNVGAVGGQSAVILDQDAWWASNDRGLYLYTGSGGPVWVGDNVSDLFDEDNPTLRVDPQAMERCVIGVNRRQNMVIMAWRARGEPEQRRRMGLEFDTGLSELGVRRDPASSVRYAMYEGPNVTALGAADRLVPGTQRLLAGTEEGFMCQLDRSGSVLELHSPGLATQVTLTSGSTTTKLVLNAAASGLQDLEGVRGVPLAWVEGSSVKRATALFCDGSNIYLDRALASAPPTGTIVSIGAIPLLWRSKRFDCGTPEARKRPMWLDVTLEPQVSGQVVVEVYADFDGQTPKMLAVNGVVVSSYVMDLTISTHKIPIGEFRARYLQFAIRTVPPAVGVQMEIVDMILSFQEEEPFA